MVDGTELYQSAIKRIQQLEKLNATLAAEIDRMRLVVDTAFDVYYGRRHEQDLGLAIRVYEAAKGENDERAVEY